MFPARVNPARVAPVQVVPTRVAPAQVVLARIASAFTHLSYCSRVVVNF